MSIKNFGQGRKVFFSEEKKQKTFISPLLPRSRPWPDSMRELAPEIKVFWFTPGGLPPFL
jgi:hypothetical protein